MERKKYLGIMLLIIIFGFLVNNISARKTQNLIATIKTIKWSSSSYPYILSNLTFFYITADIQINNPNKIDINLTSNHCGPNFLLNMTWKLNDDSIELNHYNSYESCDWSMILTFRPGITNETAFTKFSVSGSNRTILPDGEYTFWVYFTHFWITNIDSFRSILKVENGTPIFPYFPSIKFPIKNNVNLL